MPQKMCILQRNTLHATDAPASYMNFYFPDEHKDIFEMASRGGLSAPSDYCFALTTLATRYYTAMANNRSTIMLQFMKQRNQQ